MLKIIKRIQSTFKSSKIRSLKKENDVLRGALVQNIQQKQELNKDRIFAKESTIRRWKKAIDLAISAPYYNKYNLVEICNQAMFDAHTRSQISTRNNGTLSERYGLFKDQKLDKEESDLIKDTWFETIIKAILDSIYFWGTGVEIVKEDDVVKSYYIKAKYICNHRKAIVPTRHHDCISFEHFPNALFFLNTENEQLGILPIVARYAIYKSFSLSDWARHSELFGQPFLVMNTPVTDPELLEERHRALANFGHNAYILMDTDEKLTAMDVKTGGRPQDMYLDMLKHCNEEISKTIVGQTSTSDQKSWAGSAQVHERVLNSYVIADMLYIQKIINKQVLPFLVKHNILKDGRTFEWLYFDEKSKLKNEKREDIKSSAESSD